MFLNFVLIKISEEEMTKKCDHSHSKTIRTHGRKSRRKIFCADCGVLLLRLRGYRLDKRLNSIKEVKGGKRKYANKKK